MKRVLSMILALLMVVGTMVVMPLTIGAEDVEKWDGKATKPAGTGRLEDPYIIDEPGDLKWFGDQANPRVVHTLGYDHKTYVAQYESYYDGQDTIDGMLDSGSASAPGFEYSNKNKHVDWTKPMVAVVSYQNAVIDVNMEDEWQWGTKVYIKQVCDIDLNDKTITPFADYWRYVDGSDMAKGVFFSGVYDGQGYTIQNGIAKGGANGAWTTGLFGVVWGAEIKNIVFKNFHATGNGATPGIGLVANRTLGAVDLAPNGDLPSASAVAAKVGKSTIQNIKVMSDCTVTSQQCNDTVSYQYGDTRYTGAGGIVGSASNADIKSCVFLGTLYAETDDIYLGGIAGIASFGAVIDGCYFGGAISYDKAVTYSDADKDGNNDTYKVADLNAESHFGGIVGTWRGNNGGAGSAAAVKATQIANVTTVSRGVNAITNCVSNGVIDLTVSVDTDFDSTTPAEDVDMNQNGNTLCTGGIVGATANFYKGPSGSYTFSGNINLMNSNALPVATRTGGIAGCFYNSAITDAADAGKNGNTSTVETNMQKVIVSDCHSITTSVKSPGSNYPSSANQLVGGIRNAACEEDDKCTGGLLFGNMLGILTVANSFYAVNNGYFQGEGTAENPWKIGSIADWKFMEYQMASDDGAQGIQYDAFNGKYFAQTADLDFGGETINPLGVYQPLGREEDKVHFGGYCNINMDNAKGSSFRGNYDGQGYAFKNAVLKGTARTNDNWAASGIFGSLYGATVKNMVLDNVDTTVASGNIGLIAGMTRAWLDTPNGEYVGVPRLDETTGDPVYCTCKDGNGNSIAAPIMDYNYDKIKVAANVKAVSNVIEGITIKNNCDIVITKGDQAITSVGGVVGHTVGTTIRNCYSAAQITMAVSNTVAHRGIGGIVGAMGAATQIYSCIADADITFDLTNSANKEYPFGGVVGAYANTTSSATEDAKIIKDCVNLGSFKAVYTGTLDYPKNCLYYGGIVGGASSIPDTIGGHKIENCYNLSNEIEKVGFKGFSKDTENVHAVAQWRIGGLVGCYYVNNTPAKDVLEIVNSSTVDLSAINTNTYWNTYDGVICAYNRTVKDSLGADGTAKVCFTIDNTNGIAMSVAADNADIWAAAKSITVNMINAKEALHYYAAQISNNAEGAKSVRILYDLNTLTIGGLKVKEIRFNVTLVDNANGYSSTITRTQDKVYTSFLNKDYGKEGDADIVKPSEGMQYMTALTISGVPTTGDYTIYVDAMLVAKKADHTEGALHREFGVTMTIVNGVITVNGDLLQ